MNKENLIKHLTWVGETWPLWESKFCFVITLAIIASAGAGIYSIQYVHDNAKPPAEKTFSVEAPEIVPISEWKYAELDPWANGGKCFYYRLVTIGNKEAIQTVGSVSISFLPETSTADEPLQK